MDGRIKSYGVSANHSVRMPLLVRNRLKKSYKMSEEKMDQQIFDLYLLAAQVGGTNNHFKFFECPYNENEPQAGIE
jgi:hypothetical protein